MDSKTLKDKFDNDIQIVFQKAKKLGYNPNYAQQMVSEYGVIQAVKKLINSDKPSSGFAKLWELKRLELSFEAHVLRDEYSTLFTDEERKKCRQRLEENGYELDGGQ
ncbi:MAG: hypothetical protein FWE44_02890 [Defluviitaleaceae bacterium]|nr:hypothetical protein [Defluviitaleaceae bacterium]